MNILVVGSGGREHTLAWKIHQSERCENLFVIPGNAGSSSIATNVDIPISDFIGLVEFIRKNDISMVVIGPEVPLVAGLSDYILQAPGISRDMRVIGPGSEGAQLEGSKIFSKNFLEKYNIPTAKSRTFTSGNLNEGIEYLRAKPLPIVLKADGLAAGKGVIIASGYHEAEESLRAMLIDRKFGDASEKVLIEDYLDGIEVSVFILTDGRNYLVLPEAKDYKRIGDGDTGPNTGGMGAVSPVPFANTEFMAKVETDIIKPTIDGLIKENITYTGFIFLGLMNVNGEPYVIEYNVRMGDPESQAVLPRIKTDFVELLIATADGNLESTEIEFDNKAAVTVVMASEGYPGTYKKGKEIKGLDTGFRGLVFHAGTKIEDGKIKTNGGRVLAVTGRGINVTEALADAYKQVSSIRWEGAQYRKDIGKDILAWG